MEKYKIVNKSGVWNFSGGKIFRHEIIMQNDLFEGTGNDNGGGGWNEGEQAEAWTGSTSTL